MAFQHFVQNCEIKFWHVVTPVMGKAGPIRKIKSLISQLAQKKSKYLFVLVAIWGTVGFVAGLLIGRIIDIFSAV